MLQQRCIRRCSSNALRRVYGVCNGYSKSRRLNTRARSLIPQNIFSGIQPTGVPHLGNYLGALQRWVELQNEAADDTTLIYSLVDLHAITVRQEPAQLRKWKNESFAMLLAVGLNPKRSIIFHQSAVSAHSELMWILSCQASTGYLSRMTQWKEKAAGERENSEKLKLGLFSYPVLQAADVLVHRATHVPVGHDQAQHLEFAREVANGFNHVYGEGILLPPNTLISPAKRIMSLTDPNLKMSKSHANPKSRILLTDSEEEIRGKIKAAITDSETNITYDPERRPGISNLLEMVYYISVKGQYHSIEDVVKEMDGVSFRVFKELVAANVEGTVRPIRERYGELVCKEDYLSGIALAGAEKAAMSAEATLKSVKAAIGLL